MEQITTTEAAKILDRTPDWISRLCKEGILKAEKRGRDWWISKESVLAYQARGIKRGPKRKPPVA